MSQQICDSCSPDPFKHGHGFSMEMKNYIKVFLITSLLNIVCTSSSTHIINDEPETQAIYQFYNYVQAMERLRNENLLKILEQMLSKTDNTLPYDYQYLYQSISELNRSDLRDASERRRRLLQAVEYVSSLLDGHPSAVAMRRGFIYEQKAFRNRVLNGADRLWNIISAEGVRRNQRLFNFLRYMEEYRDVVTIEQMEELQRIMSEDYGIKS